MAKLEHPELETERDFIERAYAQLDRSRIAAASVTGNVESGRGGTHQARFERDVLAEAARARLDDLDIGDQSLVFGRIDRDLGDHYHIGRVAVSDQDHNPMVIDWRAPVAEPFYRATGRQTMGLTRRRHFMTRFRELLGIEDEYFAEDEDPLGTSNPESRRGGGTSDPTQRRLKGQHTLIRALESARSGRLGDIVATIQGEQDEIVRAPLSGIKIVQGGPGTGKTVVALHRAAYLLYTHRFPLSGQGVMVIGPNRLFLTYIEQVLPSLGESGVELAVLGDFIPNARVRGNDPSDTATIKGDQVMISVLKRVVKMRQQPLRNDLVITYGLQRLRLTVEQSRKLVADTRRRSRFHNQGRRFLVDGFYRSLADSGRYEVDPGELRDNLAHTEAVREALEWMWPVLSPTELLHDLFGSEAMLRSALDAQHQQRAASLYRQRSHHSEVLWTNQDVPLLDEAWVLLGPRSGRTGDHQMRTYGHIVIDEAQDLSPMQLRMISRRSLNGSMTVVGDLAQGTSVWAHDNWETVVDALPKARGVSRYHLTVGYRLPGPLIELAGKVLVEAMPELAAPEAVRPDGDPPRFVTTTRAQLGRCLAEAIEVEREAIGSGNIAIICATDQALELSQHLERAGVKHGATYSQGLEREISVIEVSMVKGLEIDAAIVIDPDLIVEKEPRGHRSLYVALTRATRRLCIVDTGGLATSLGQPRHMVAS